MPSMPVKHHFSYLSIHQAEWNEPKLSLYVWTYLTWYNFLLFSRKIFEEDFVLPAQPSNEKNSSDHHNSYNKDQDLAFFNFTESPSNFLLTIKFPKNHITSSYHRNLPKTVMAKNWPLKSFRD
jgi:hypothetical protein